MHCWLAQSPVSWPSLLPCTSLAESIGTAPSPRPAEKWHPYRSHREQARRSEWRCSVIRLLRSNKRKCTTHHKTDFTSPSLWTATAAGPHAAACRESPVIAPVSRPCATLLSTRLI